MKTTVFELTPDLEVELEPKNYPYGKEDVPLGTYTAKLDFMLWSKSGLTINCFFTLEDSHRKISLSVYRKAANQGRYLAGEIEVRYLPFGTLLELTVEANALGKPRLTNMVMKKQQ
ncbi:hypothetical protein G7074_25860 [Pedobacter sp. HDW13]|uniref:hypothetical protein n=1 Tax=Pedobacter sp. HDW13 TaxID=2714940 RepID=UPI0014098056|nr:hypothetical protein [Pedobacter sp. HDW13]QIL42385.1 hypothetical protein G7074_25860 [Pedobacter sp. HDW13]